MLKKIEEPLVSILINNYNYGRFLQSAVESSLNQTYRNIEIIIVDDGSTDKSREILEAYSAVRNIKVILKSNGGQASAFNAGFENSSGDIICFLDADDIFHYSKVDSIVDSFANGNNTIGWLFHYLDLFENKFELSSQYSDVAPQSSFEEVKFYDLQDNIKKGKLNGYIPLDLNIATSGLCYKRQLLKKILPMPENIRITSDDYLKYASMGTSPGLISSKKLAYQRIHSDNAYTLRPNSSYLKAKTQVITAFFLLKFFPELKNFSNNLLSMGIYLFWCEKKMDKAYKELVQEYFSSIEFYERFLIYTKAAYYRCLYFLSK